MKGTSSPAFALGLLIVAVFGAFVYWLLWLFWCAVFGAAWPTGPDAIVRPGFWLFAGEWLLMLLLVRVARGIFRK